MIVRYGRVLFGSFFGFLSALLVFTIVDCFISPFAIGALSFNARYIYLIIYALAWLGGAIMNTRHSFRTGPRV